jgi:hypothetical protein
MEEIAIKLAVVVLLMPTIALLWRLEFRRWRCSRLVHRIPVKPRGRGQAVTTLRLDTSHCTHESDDQNR